MKHYRKLLGSLVVGGLLITPNTFANDHHGATKKAANKEEDEGTPSEAQVTKLMAAMKSDRMVEAIASSVNQAVLNTAQARLKNTLQDKAPSPEQQQLIKKNVEQFNLTVKDQLSWDKIEPTVVAAYQKTFTSKEVRDLTLFYSSKTGQSVIEKLPNLQKQLVTDLISKELVALQPPFDAMMANLSDALKKTQ